MISVLCPANKNKIHAVFLPDSFVVESHDRRVFDLGIESQYIWVAAQAKAFVQQPVGFPRDLRYKLCTAESSQPVCLSDKGAIVEAFESELIHVHPLRRADPGHLVMRVPRNDQQLMGPLLGD